MSEEFLLLEFRVGEDRCHQLEEIEADLASRTVGFYHNPHHIDIYAVKWEEEFEIQKTGDISSTFLLYLVCRMGNKKSQDRLREILASFQKEPFNELIGNRNGIYLVLQTTSIIGQRVVEDYLYEDMSPEDDDEFFSEA